ncbi:serine--tRNA ligase [Schleiferia thermophila]|jgi:seryl-tRNA synthetase|uniref:Serine--tRNA ligase n=1 Tax=Schleiferia thermophila TaxID=884107 RepID=A0A369A8J1_9FLAO|nr:serine--tRNA ligase [Schleiferia thermophila]KFD38933.1 seryl-tRNA synthetase [Schleiferia thermophila str. Yellowstone]PMB12589.1 serine--tRNA ligase [Fischerella thermalis CCMEE 5319]RCX03744.1 seryl-tRNA synthetase [Schleiferia thermophila]GCD79978.1 serine--tRNA ligase [Schleiferia thermophila]
MLVLQEIRENREKVIEALKKRNLDAEGLVNSILDADSIRRAIQTDLDNIRNEANLIGKQVGALQREGKRNEAQELMNKSAALKERIKELTEQLKEAEIQLRDILLTVPNAPAGSVKPGKSAEDNEVVAQWGEPLQLPDDAKPHWDIARELDIIDFELGVKVTGSGFPVYKGKGARLQRALIQYFLDYNTRAGYLEVQPPHFVNEASGFGTGQLPDKEGQMYYIERDGLYAIPTAEVPVTNFFRDVILSENELPQKLTAYTPCFRREAGSYGAHVRGLNRLHQFDKVEIVVISHPEDSYRILEEMVDHVAGLLQSLKLPYRILRLCGGDMGFASAMTYDFEVWSAAQKRWLEVSSVSNFETFQANRLQLRFKDSNGKNRLCHTLNGSSLALPRVVAALLENNFDGNRVKLPEIVAQYAGFDSI